jgi:hypothetical protein
VSSKFHFVAVCVAFLGAGGVASLPGSSVADTQSAFRKLGAIERGGVKPGTRLNFTKPEIDGWIQDEAKSHVPQGLDHVRLDLSDGRVTGYANIDFLKVRQASGGDPGWLMKNLFAGERPVTVVAGEFGRRPGARGCGASGDFGRADPGSGARLRDRELRSSHVPRRQSG